MGRNVVRSAIAVVAGLAMAPQAGAATIQGSSTGVFVVDASGEVNVLEVVATAAGYQVTDAAAPLTPAAVPGNTCVPTGLNSASCVVTGNTHSSTLRLGGGNDRATWLAATRVTLEGGAGDDLLTAGAGMDSLVGGDGRDALYAGDGDDVLLGDAGDDELHGGAGDDILRPGSGSDVMAGGSGSDDADYFDEGRGVTASLDGVRNDGLAGEDHILGDVENLFSRGHDDTLIGNDGANLLQSGAGNDHVVGLGGDDFIWSQTGDDTADGGDGDDYVDDEFGDDTLIGGAGDDRVRAWSGTDLVDLGTGDDHLVGATSGTTTVTYASRGVPITATVGDGHRGSAGEAGEVDVLEDVEAVIGGAADDLLSAATAALLDGGAGHDRLTGSAAADTLVGGGGRDFFDAGAGTDVIEAGDRLRDTGTCGDGADTATVDPQDALTGCEQEVRR